MGWNFTSLLPSKNLVCGGFQYRTATGRFGRVEFHYSIATVNFDVIDVRCNTVTKIFDERCQVESYRTGNFDELVAPGNPLY